MKKLPGIRFGGLRLKILSLVLVVIFVLVADFLVMSSVRNRLLSKTIDQTRIEQQQSITQTSTDTTHAMLENSLNSIIALTADSANNEFLEVVNYIRTMQAMAEGIFANRDKIEPQAIYPPDPSNNGILGAHVLTEAGVDYTQSEYIGYAAHLSDSLIAMQRSFPRVSSCFIGFQDGTHMSISRDTSNRYNRSGKLIPYPVRQRPWYRGALNSDDLFFTKVEKDAFSGALCITCSAPVHNNGEIIGVVGADIILDNMLQFMRNPGNDWATTIVINEYGQVILAPKGSDLFTVDVSSKAVDMRTVDSPVFARLVTQALKEQTALSVDTLMGREYYIIGAPMPSIGWAVVILTDREVIERSTTQMLADMDQINSKAMLGFREGTARITFVFSAVIVLILIVSQAAALIFARRIAKPVEAMTESIVKSGQTGEPFAMEDVYRTNDEIELLAKSFDDLSRKTRQYIQDITTITREKERISTELDLARKIQADMMPYIYPAFPSHTEFDVYGTMNPAKEVGGDFFDYYMVDDDHLAVVVADVSGKGVPAALFMMMSKIIINNYAMLDQSPAKILERTNAAICQNNEQGMFVTVWLGIMEISTGRIVAANAGHEYPVLKGADGRFELIRDKHGFVLGAMESLRYTDYEFTLEKGGILFLYTDGVTESTNRSDEMFGTDRLLETLNQCAGQGPVELLTSVSASIRAFVGDADQFDDITMLGLTRM